MEVDQNRAQQPHQLMMTKDFWNNILWTNETNVQISGVMYSTTFGEHLKPTVRRGGGGVMV